MELMVDGLENLENLERFISVRWFSLHRITCKISTRGMVSREDTPTTWSRPSLPLYLQHEKKKQTDYHQLPVRVD